ncbi:hypothetical protein B0T26DRAFT_659791, partial [Lasiosphaeria miniovina]
MLADTNGQSGETRELEAHRRALLIACEQRTPEARVLAQLYFDSIYFREDQIRAPQARTFRWIIEDLDGTESENDRGYVPEREPPIHTKTRQYFQAWLAQGAGVLHVSGKAGSGKSTLMKLVSTHKRTQEKLNEWAGDKKLVFARFFAWKGGQSGLQNSLEGLYRSILFEVLRACPRLIPSVFPDAISSFQTTPASTYHDKPFFRPALLHQALERLISDMPKQGYRFCIFIDGLDEFQNNRTSGQDHAALEALLDQWGKNSDVKLLVSSRPHAEFTSVFSENKQLTLHKLNYCDILDYGHDVFRRRLPETASLRDYYRLLSRVAKLSSGVFL